MPRSIASESAAINSASRSAGAPGLAAALGSSIIDVLTGSNEIGGGQVGISDGGKSRRRRTQSLAIDHYRLSGGMSTTTYWRSTDTGYVSATYGPFWRPGAGASGSSSSSASIRALPGSTETA